MYYKRQDNYFCYNPYKHDFLLNLQIYPIDADIHKGTKKIYWIYKRNDKLYKAFKLWRKSQELKFNK